MKKSQNIRMIFMVLLVIFLAAGHGVAATEWRWHKPLPEGNEIADLWVDPESNNVFAVGAYGTILHYDGTTWRLMDSGLKQGQELFAIWGRSANDVFAVGGELLYDSSRDGFLSYAMILHYDGSTWSRMTCPKTEKLYDVWGSPSGDVFAVGEHGVILHYNSEGGCAGWCEMDLDTYHDTPPFLGQFSGVWGTSSDDVFAVGAKILSDGTFPVIFHYDGNTWSEMTCPDGEGDLFGVWGASSDDFFAVGGDRKGNGIIFHYDGNTWSQMDSPFGPSPESPSDFIDVWGTSGSDVYALCQLGGVMVHYDGSTWSQIDIPRGGYDAATVCGSSGDNIFVAFDSYILHYDGSTWSEEIGRNEEIDVADQKGVWVNAPDDVFVVGGGISFSNPPVISAGDIIHYDGCTWSKMSCPVAQYLGVWGSGPDDVFAVGGRTVLSPPVIMYYPVIAHYDGCTWSEMTVPDHLTFIAAVWGSSASDVFAVSTGGTIIHYDGSTWNTMARMPDIEFRDIWGIAPDDIFAVGHDKNSCSGAIIHYDGSAWSKMNCPTTDECFWLQGVWGSGPDDVFAVGHYDKSYIDPEDDAVILHYDGSTWSKMPVSSQNDLYSVWGTSSSNVFAVGGDSASYDAPAFILHYDGITWSEMSCPPAPYLSDIHGSGPDNIFTVSLYQSAILHYGDSTFSGNCDDQGGTDGTSSGNCVDQGGAIDIMGAQATLEDGAIIRVPINIRNAYKPDPANEIFALGFDVLFDPERLEFVEFEPGELLANFTMTGCNEAFGEGVARIGGFTTDNPVAGWSADPIEPDEEGVLGYLKFHYLSDPRCARLELDNLVDDIENWSAPDGYLLPGCAPTADAGEDHEVMENTLAALDGSNSFDPDGVIATYLWKQTGGPEVTLSDPSVAKPTFTVPADAIGSSLTFQLTVTDHSGLSDSDTVVLTIVPFACVTMPDQPILLSPANGAEGVSLTPTLQASEYNDPGTCSTHWKTRWQISEQKDFSGLTYNANTIYKNLTSLKVTRKVLKPGTTYYWRVRYWGDHGLKSDWSEIFSFTTVSDCGYDGCQDHNKNGVPDDQESESSIDMNDNGIPDANEINLRSLMAADGLKNICLKFSDDVLSVAIETISEDEIGDAQNMPGDFPYGLIAYRAKVANFGETVRFTIYLQDAAPKNAAWYKYDSVNGWYDFTSQVTFHSNRRALTFQLTDGGVGDADGVANGVVVDPAGLLVPSSQKSTTSGSGAGLGSGSGSGCFIDSCLQ